MPAKGVDIQFKTDANAQPVLLISIDGMRTDYLWKASQYGIVIPNLQMLINEGTLAKGAYSVFPSLTFASHTSMITGVNPAIHGIYTNNILDPYNDDGDRNFFYSGIQVPTIFDIAAQAGFTLIGVDWPVTVGANPFKFIYPGNDDSPNDADEAKFLYATMRGPFQNIIKSWKDLFSVSDQQRGDMAIAFIEAAKPTLSAVHYNNLDEMEHIYGYMSNQAIAQLEKIDSYIGELLDALQQMGTYQNTTIIVVSDHGFVNTTEVAMFPASLLSSLGLIGSNYGLDWLTFPLCSGGLCAIYINPQAPPNVTEQVDGMVTLLADNPIYKIRQVYNAEQIKLYEMFAGAYVVLECGYNFSMTEGMSPTILKSHYGSRGQHGYSPLRPEMYASFLIKGPNINSGKKIGMVSLIDVAPTIAYILGLNMTNIEGSVVKEAFKKFM